MNLIESKLKTQVKDHNIKADDKVTINIMFTMDV